MGSDLSLSSLSLTASSDSSESRDLEATSVAMEAASASHATRSPSHAFIVQAGVPSAGPWPPVVENPIPPYYLGNEPCGSTCVQGTEGSNILHSPSNAQVLQSEQVFVEPDVRDGEYHGLLDRLLGLNFVYDNSAQGEGSQAPYFPSYYPALVNFDDDEHIGAYLSVLSHNRSELSSRADVSSSQQDLLHCPEFRIGGLIESHGLCGAERTNLSRHSSPSAEQLTREIISSRQSLETNRMQKASDEVVAEDSPEKEAGEKNRCATNFDCNICFDIAKEPVVTSCGHLFCWPCLYQWLRVHSDYKECPVCKGEVTEADVTPIYGRGCCRSDDENKDEGNTDSGPPIPPRPRGNRLESVRERFYTISRMVGEGIANSQSRFLDYQIHNRSRFSGHEDVFLWGLSENPVSIPRSMIIELQREQGIIEDEPNTVERRFPRDGESVPRDDGTESIHNEFYTGQGLHCFPANDRLDCMNSEIGRAPGRFAENTNFFGPSSFDNSPNPGQSVSIPILGARPATDQPSASSTLAVIYSESSARDGSAELNSVGSSRTSRRIRGSNSSGSSDDGGNLRARKRRRLH